uniref:Striatin interacting protein 2 n=1 Tax=Callorhinchus milii TaxID=7868 RepID=A0A4W3IYY2_CALMI
VNPWLLSHTSAKPSRNLGSSNNNNNDNNNPSIRLGLENLNGSSIHRLFGGESSRFPLALCENLLNPPEVWGDVNVGIKIILLTLCLAVKGKKWVELDEAEHKAYIMRLLDGLEVINREKRLKFARAILYLAQGVFDDCYTEPEVVHWAQYNVFLLYEMGTFGALVELLNMEIENSQACSSALRKPAISLADSTELRVLLNIMCLMVEAMRLEVEDDRPEWKVAREGFRTELGSSVYNGEPFAILLFSVVNKFCSGCAPHFPIKKVLLLLWKTVLFSLGGFEELQALNVRKRQELGLPVLHEDSIQVTRSLRAASPPASALDLLEQQQRRGRRGRKVLVKQDSLDTYNEKDPYKTDEAQDDEENGEDPDSGIEGEMEPLDPPPHPRLPPERVFFPRGLPWAPKVRWVELDKCLGENLSSLVKFRCEINIIIIIIILALSHHVELTPTEALYQGMLHNLPQYMIALLKILLAAAPTSKAKTDSINILADVLPEEMPVTVLQSMKLGIDVNRHKEIIVKSVSALMLLLLKHFKLNHIYQFEYVSQHLVFANCIPLILKFFNQNIMSYIAAKNGICVLDYPHCVIHELPEFTTETLEAGDNSQFCWRNLFSCINLLRILNKLTKWKHSRTMMLVVFKSAPILKRGLRVKQATMQLYALKLLKLQTKYLGRQWRKSNMKTMSAIYHKVRHRLNDDWAYGNEIDARPWDFQAEECALRVRIESFNARRYGLYHCDFEFAPVDNCLQSVLGHCLQLPDDFRYSYELWLEREVFAQPIRWEKLLQPLA